MSAGEDGVHGFVVKAGEMVQGAGGMVRSSSAGKLDVSLVYDGVMLERWARLLTRATMPPPAGPGYPAHNWLLALEDPDIEARRAVYERARASAARHLFQWMNGDRDEDHAAAVMFNLNVAETILPTLETELPF